VEGYFVDDMKDVVVNSKNQSLRDSYVVFDIETTGFSPVNNKIIEIGAVKVENGKITGRFSEFVNPKEPIPFRIEELTSITDDMVQDAPEIDVILPKFLDFCQGSSLVAHNAEFDTSFIRENCRRLSLPYDFTVVDTLPLARLLLTDMAKFRLNNICKKLGISLENHHRAIDDATATGEVFEKFVEMLENRGVTTLDGVNDMAAVSAEMIRKSPTYHGIILVKNETGRVNLNRLVSASHIDYFSRRPRMPKSLIQKYREGLILGSACEAGELYQALLSKQAESEIARIVNFYDYLEIQPCGNNTFMIESDRHEDINSIEDIQEINKKIIELGKRYNKPVVATCDVHFLDPEDEQYRRIMMAGKGFKDADNQAPLYFRTTEEMLEEFSYLGAETAYEVVVTNTNKIADQIEKISPVHPDKCPPVIPDSDKTLRDICYTKAHEIYGPNLPNRVTDRLEHELQSIISNGFAVMYIIAQKLVWDSNDHGYLVGSRGSVGSSFVATMSGITEVNPLSAHYICPKCYYVDFDSDLVKPYAQKGMSGCDMPDAHCPKCGTLMNKEGHDIPFETFLGFKGDKEPDIDLNFSGDYQAKAHAYVEVIFGKGKAYRAGTIGTLAEKTAFGYVYKYFEEREIHKRRCEMERIAEGCTGVKRTTGQHPGGIIVVPHDREIYEFTAIQHPANDVHTPIVTTHFEYHSIDHNLLKLDILGHDDPTMIRRLEDLTGIDAKTIKLDDKDVMSLFHSTDALGIKPEDIHGIPLGSLGIPEFGTDFVIQMLLDTKPKSFSDLVRISGLSHGTDVWLGNAQTLIEEGKAEISTAICTRDDIMTYLINQGMDKGLSFTIMESVRKGKGLKPEWEEAMTQNGVPDWYIWSCKKIKYMFPKAHAAAYVMMAWRIAYFKVFYPLAYYTAFFSIRASAFSYELMCQGKEKLEFHMKELESASKDALSKKDQDTLKDMRIVQEMYARGFEFTPIELDKADDKKFQIIDGKIMPSLSSIDGMGEKAAEAVKEATKDGPYTSLDNFRMRTKISKTSIDKMVELGILAGLPESDQLSFDFL
jgi:DNA polymerase-3 subunit alpha (Gram-positive type)